MTKETALKIFWDSCIHNEETKEAYEVLKNEVRPQNDLISRSALKEQFSEIVGEYIVSEIISIIDNVPTVNFMISPDYVTELQNRNKELIRQLEEAERPKGEWADHNTCPFCNHTYDWEYNFCPNCGADLRGDTE